MNNNNPRLAEILGVNEDEQFKVKGCKENVYRIHNGVREVLLPGRWEKMDSEAALTELINDPSRIIRESRFSDEEMAVLRAMYQTGIVHFSKDENGVSNWVYDRKRHASFIADTVTRFTRPGESVDLEAMFGGGE